MRKVDLASIVFFAGILLSVGALRHLGILSLVSQELFGEAPTVLQLVLGNTTLGVLSAFVDNIPLTAAAIDILVTDDPQLWVLLSLTVGTGGSHARHRISRRRDCNGQRQRAHLPQLHAYRNSSRRHGIHYCDCGVVSTVHAPLVYQPFIGASAQAAAPILFRVQYAMIVL